MTDVDSDIDRGRSLNRFQQSLKRLDPPAWTRYSDHQHRPAFGERRLLPLVNPVQDLVLGLLLPPVAFKAVIGRWSASTLCSDGQFSNGDNTPTDSVISAFSMRSSLQGTEPIYHPPPMLPVMGRPPYGAGSGYSTTKRPYLGWRSQDSLINGAAVAEDGKSRYLTPAERLAWSCKQQQQRAASMAVGTSGGGGLGLNPRQARVLHQHQLVHDSIKSVSTAIMEFCQAEDVPQPPPLPAVPPAVRRRKEHRAQIVWLESSFVSSEAKSKL